MGEGNEIGVAGWVFLSHVFLYTDGTQSLPSENNPPPLTAVTDTLATSSWYLDISSSSATRCCKPFLPPSHCQTPGIFTLSLVHIAVLVAHWLLCQVIVTCEYQTLLTLITFRTLFYRSITAIFYILTSVSLQCRVFENTLPASPH